MIELIVIYSLVGLVIGAKEYFEGGWGLSPVWTTLVCGPLMWATVGSVCIIRKLQKR